MRMKYFTSVNGLTEADTQYSVSYCIRRSVSTHQTMEHGEDLTPQQEQTLQQFVEKVSSFATCETDKHPYFLVKWLIARDFNIEKAEKMFKKSQKWREEYDISSLLDWNPPEVLTKYNAFGIPGFDKHGGAIMIVPYGKVDIRGIFHSAKKEDFLKYILKRLETSKAMMIEESKKRNREYCRVTCIFDMDDFAIKEFMWKPAMEAVAEVFKLYEANYPEYLHAAYVVNAPKVFSIAWAFVKPFLNPHTIDKVHIFGKTGWKEELLKEISAEVLPKHWGGNRMEPDEYCTSFMCMGGKVPTSYYLKNRSTSHLTTVTVGKGSSVTIDVPVKESNSTVRWEFETDDYDICFSLYPKDDPESPLVPSSRVDSHIIRNEGEVVCTQEGMYVAVFDNSYSYVRSKVVRYSFQVTPPVMEE